MKVPFFDLNRIYNEMKSEIDGAVHRTLNSGLYILGWEVQSFETEMKEILVSKSQEGFFIGCNSGTDALILSLLARGVGPDNEVLTVSHTAIPTITAIVSTGAIPRFVDVDPLTWVMDISKVRNAITSKTKAVIAVHLYGNMVNISLLQDLLKEMGREDITVIEDVAQAQGSILNDGKAGTLGHLGAFSFYPTKNIGAMGDGGGVFTASSKDYERLKMLRNYGQRDRYSAEVVRGINSRLDEVQASILRAKLHRVTEWKMKKDSMMESYGSSLRGLAVQFQEVTLGCKPDWHLAVIRLESQQVRDSLQSFLEKEGVQTIVHYPLPNHRQKAFSHFAEDSNLSETESLAACILSLPFNIGLTTEEQSYVVSSIQRFFKL